MVNRIGRGVAEKMRQRGVLNDGTRIFYATGLFITSHGGVIEISHGGATGGYRAWLGAYPSRKLSVALLRGAAEANSTALAHAVVDFVLHSPTPVTRAAKTPDAIRYSGLFLDSHDRSLKLTLKDGILTAGSLGALVPVSDGRFHTAAGSELSFSEPDVLIVAGENGRDRYRRLPLATMLTDNAGLAGRCVSSDVGATYRVIPREDMVRLALETRPRVGFTGPARDGPVHGRGGGRDIRFHRNPHGEVDGLSYANSNRVVDLRSHANRPMS